MPEAVAFIIVLVIIVAEIPVVLIVATRAGSLETRRRRVSIALGTTIFITALVGGIVLSQMYR